MLGKIWEIPILPLPEAGVDPERSWARSSRERFFLVFLLLQANAEMVPKLQTAIACFSGGPRDLNSPKLILLLKCYASLFMSMKSIYNTKRVPYQNQLLLTFSCVLEFRSSCRILYFRDSSSMSLQLLTTLLSFVSYRPDINAFYNHVGL